jgi:hypothetical protein
MIAQTHIVSQEKRFAFLLWAAAAVGFVVAMVGVAAAMLETVEPLSGEGRWLESISCALWLLALIVSGLTFFRWKDRADRLTAVWMGIVALLAGLRELDAHIYLNPQYLGDLGVRYRMDWWLSGNVSILLKLGWFCVFFAFAFPLAYIPLKLRLPLFRMARLGDPMVGLFILGIGLLGMGFVMDDTLRHTKLLSHGGKQVIEETSETLGAIFFLISGILRWRTSFAERIAGLR